MNGPGKQPVTRNDGKEFERRVANALQLSGLRVSTEELVAGKKADLTAVELRFGAEWRILVECKDYDRALTRSQLNSIVLDYQPLLDEGRADELLVVTRKPAAPAALTYSRGARNLTLRVLSDIENSVMKLGSYIEQAKTLFERSGDGVAKYYVSPQTKDQHDAVSLLVDWVKGNSSILSPDDPVAVLGAYGMGKSVLAKRLTSDLAGFLDADPSARVPITIELGELAKEQSLEGLICTHFSARYNVENFTFARFLEMNKMGRFVIILDGFDEMKHMLTSQEFRYNFSQLGRLHGPNTRTIILGRPTAFESEEEMDEILRRSTSEIALDTPAHSYQEIELAPLSPSAVDSFLQGYIEDEYELSRVRELVGLRQFDDIAKRPVQLRMLAQVLPTFEGRIESLDLPTLYELVIADLIGAIIEREMSKGARIAFDKKKRREFLQLVAFWLWEQRAGTVSTSTMIPDSLVLPFASDDADLTVVRRDLVTGSPLDRRPGDRLFFPHRSFQEYLVAIESLRRLELGQLDIGGYDALATEEVAEFVRQSATPAQRIKFRNLLDDFRGSLSWPTARSLVEWDSAPDWHSQTVSPWGYLALCLPSIENGDPVDLKHTIEWLRGKAADDFEAPLLALFCVCASRPNVSIDDTEIELISDIVGLLMSRGSGDEQFTSDHLDALSNGRTFNGKRRGRRHMGLQEIDVEIPSEYANRKLQLIPLTNGFVGDLRVGQRRIGRTLGKGQLVRPHPDGTKIAANGAKSVQIRWATDAAISAADTISGGGTWDVRRLNSLFAGVLPEYAFLTNWTNDEKLVRSVRFPKPFKLRDGTVAFSEQIGQALRAYEPVSNRRGGLDI